jgi:hypothetical protein
LLASSHAKMGANHSSMLEPQTLSPVDQPRAPLAFAVRFPAPPNLAPGGGINFASAATLVALAARASFKKWPVVEGEEKRTRERERGGG